MRKEKHNLADHWQILRNYAGFWWNYYVIAAILMVLELLPGERAGTKRRFVWLRFLKSQLHLDLIEN